MRHPRSWYPVPGSPPPKMNPGRLLAPAGWAHTRAARLRRRLTRPVRVDAPVVCIGALVAGGAGKTPVALMLARRLAERGTRVHILTRGYGGVRRGPVRVDPQRHDAADVGDEALLLARAAPTWVSRNRPAGARAAVGDGAELIVMDDGFQNPGLHKDASLLVVDARQGAGNGRVLPAGPLREPVGDALTRAHGVIMLEGAPPRDLEAALARSGLPVLRGRLVAGARIPPGGPLLMFAGLGWPEKFRRTLEDMEAQIAAVRIFPDHHLFTDAEARIILDQAARLHARPVTTAKDAVRLAGAPEGSPRQRLLRCAIVVPVRVELERPAQLDLLLADLPKNT